MKITGLIAIAVVSIFVGFAVAEGAANICSETADALFVACKAGVKDDSFVMKAKCLNLTDSSERADCFAELASDKKDGLDLCAGQRDTRLETCKLLGPGPYDPQLNPAGFDSDFTNLTNPNPYFPLTIGYQWKFEGGGEVNVVDVLNETKLINGIRCIVFQDQVFVNGNLTESTNDWYAQALNKNAWYFGEETGEYETFEGDNPQKPELVNIDGSFKAGRDLDKGGIIFLGNPHPGDVYLEEFSLGNAEDATVILSTNYSYGNDSELDQFVPKQLADRFCSGNCVVTKNFSLLEPGIFARKYYAQGVGVILEVEINPDGNTVSQLVDCNFDSRCTGLPTP